MFVDGSFSVKLDKIVHTLASNSQLWYHFSALVVKNNIRDWCVSKLFTSCDVFRSSESQVIIYSRNSYRSDHSLTIKIQTLKISYLTEFPKSFLE